MEAVQELAERLPKLQRDTDIEAETEEVDPDKGDAVADAVPGKLSREVDRDEGRTHVPIFD